MTVKPHNRLAVGAHRLG